MLSKLQVSKRCIVLTIHQPRQEIFHLFTHILLLVGGQVCSYGILFRVLSMCIFCCCSASNYRLFTSHINRFPRYICIAGLWVIRYGLGLYTASARPYRGRILAKERPYLIYDLIYLSSLVQNG